MIFLWAYLALWMAISAVSFGASRRLGARARPVAGIVIVSVLAGGLWPVLLLGVAEFSSVAAYASAERWLVTPFVALGAIDPVARGPDGQD